MHRKRVGNDAKGVVIVRLPNPLSWQARDKMVASGMRMSELKGFAKARGRRVWKFFLHKSNPWERDGVVLCFEGPVADSWRDAEFDSGELESDATGRRAVGCHWKYQ